ncbi:MAG TPA: hypothetical protein VHZ76_07060 [Gammaproteobacteria bacterium]|jgi:prophage maintenance system killer protein|nr:hypothetical protein [Gammaproteobacteria bacterium]
MFFRPNNGLTLNEDTIFKYYFSVLEDSSYRDSIYRPYNELLAKIRRISSKLFTEHPSDYDKTDLDNELNLAINNLNEMCNNLFPASDFLKFTSRKDLWRLFIDGKDQEANNPLIYDEKEPGYFVSTHECLFFMNRSLNTRLSPELLVHLHQIAMQGMVDEEGHSIKSDFSCKDNPIKNYFPLDAVNTTQAGLEERYKNHYLEVTNWSFNVPDIFGNGCGIEKYTDPSRSTELCMKLWENIQNKHIRLFCNTYLENASRIIEKLNFFINNYYDEIKEADEDSRKIIVTIAKFCINLNVTHIFSDGNIRLANIILQKLLLENKLPTAILHNPNYLDGYSAEEMADEIELGIKHSLEIMMRHDMNKKDSFEKEYGYFIGPNCHKKNMP